MDKWNYLLKLTLIECDLNDFFIRVAELSVYLKCLIINIMLN
jgi:hypothetical protein